MCASKHTAGRRNITPRLQPEAQPWSPIRRDAGYEAGTRRSRVVWATPSASSWVISSGR